ncbi:cytochrome-c peroxidase [Croceivirga thetidis]|uniref:Cytochrome-c peroxidase n=1 Tax=Croceivirga thetidis TaxID=2721623 RepID=A0ABX1GLD4_9FLAO|nr:cytochrome c peroxidase [Croceivirga thetidis]NKI30691.1 cytochrome-c peroxidase [Croceivirga thetidis]
MFQQAKRLALYILALLPFLSCEPDFDFQLVEDSNLENEVREELTELLGSLDRLILPESDAYSQIPNDLRNPITAEKVALGKFLFHETELGVAAKVTEGLKTYSCASCHHAKAGFQSGMKQGIGEGGWGFGTFGELRIANSLYPIDSIDVQPIRSPTILNTAYQDVMLWNGQFGATGTNAGTEASWTEGTPKARNNLGFQGLEIQAIAGMGVHRLNVSPENIDNGAYKALFDAAYPDIDIDQRYSLENAGLAIAAFERTVLSNEAPFQKFLKGETGLMSDDELKGAQLFFGKAKCMKCHSGPGLNGMEFHALGMNDLSGNDVIGQVDAGTAKGRGGFTNDSNDDYKFKTPTLYNLKDVQFLGHGGSFSTVREVIAYKNNAIAENNLVPTERLSDQFQALGLTDEEISQLTMFIENSLYDPNLSRYVPAFTPLGTSCFPNADEQSLLDMGCN